MNLKTLTSTLNLPTEIAECYSVPLQIREAISSKYPQLDPTKVYLEDMPVYVRKYATYEDVDYVHHLKYTIGSHSARCVLPD